MSCRLATLRQKESLAMNRVEKFSFCPTVRLILKTVQRYARMIKCHFILELIKGNHLYFIQSVLDQIALKMNSPFLQFSCIKLNFLVLFNVLSLKVF